MPYPSSTASFLNKDLLQIQVGFASEKGRREANEDYCAFRESDSKRATREWVIAIADGLGGGPGGRLAAETLVRGFLDGYFSFAETLGVDRIASKVFTSLNQWVYAQNQQDAALRGMATTFSALILRGRYAHVVHVGDTRIYRLRDQKLECLTQDHAHAHPDLRHVLYRAVGLEETTRADYARHDCRVHDRFLLCSDGIHAVLRHVQLIELLAERAAPEETARRLVEFALEAGSQDNLTAVVIDVISVAPIERLDLELEAMALPIRDLPKAGEMIDNFHLLEVISNGRYSRLFRAEDLMNGKEVVLKFPQPRVRLDTTVRHAFAREAWITQQVKSAFVVEVLELARERQTCLYATMPYYRGENLEARLKRSPSIKLTEGVDIAVKLGRAIHALNRLRIIHRDIKPENVLLLPDSGAGLKLLDLGVARLPGTEQSLDSDIPGTPSYMAPELLKGERGDERSDVYAFGVTLYRMFSGGHYPYGEVEAFSQPRFKRPVPLSRYRPDLPAWLDTFLARAIALNPTERYGDALELALELEHNAAQGPTTLAPRRLSLYERNPLRFWQGVSLLLLIALVWIGLR